jgi:hypothetical protein
MCPADPVTPKGEDDADILVLVLHVGARDQRSAPEKHNKRER